MITISVSAQMTDLCVREHNQCSRIRILDFAFRSVVTQAGDAGRAQTPGGAARAEVAAAEGV